MDYIKEFAVKNLNKNAVIEFFENLKLLMEACLSLQTILPDKYAEMMAAVNEVFRWGQLTQKSNLTEPIQNLDRQRDSFLDALDAALKALVLSANQEIREQAIAVQNKVNSIDVPRNAQYFQESGALDMLLEALLGQELVEAVTAIGVKPIVELIKGANDEMHRLILERNAESAAKPAEAFEKARRTAEAVYRDYVFFLNAYIGLNINRAGQTDASLETFVRDLNEFLRKYNITQFPNTSKPNQAATTPPSEEQQPGETTPGEQQPGAGEQPGTPGGGTQEPGGEEQEPTMYWIAFIFADNSQEDAQYAEGATIDYPTPTTGYRWPTTAPTVMPAHDVTVTEERNPNQPPPATGGGESGFD